MMIVFYIWEKEIKNTPLNISSINKKLTQIKTFKYY